MYTHVCNTYHACNASILDFAITRLSRQLVTVDNIILYNVLHVFHT